MADSGGKYWEDYQRLARASVSMSSAVPSLQVLHITIAQNRFCCSSSRDIVVTNTRWYRSSGFFPCLPWKVNQLWELQSMFPFTLISFLILGIVQVSNALLQSHPGMSFVLFKFYGFHN